LKKTQSSPQLKRKRSDDSLDDDNLHRNDAHPEMEVEEAAGRVLDVRISLGPPFILELTTIYIEKAYTYFFTTGR
jgi:hypothetical protein